MNDLKEKTEYDLIMNDYNNNYGYDFGINFKTNKEITKNSLIKDILNVKKR